MSVLITDPQNDRQLTSCLRESGCPTFIDLKRLLVNSNLHLGRTVWTSTLGSGPVIINVRTSVE